MPTFSNMERYTFLSGIMSVFNLFFVKS